MFSLTVFFVECHITVARFLCCERYSILCPERTHTHTRCMWVVFPYEFFQRKSNDVFSYALSRCTVIAYSACQILYNYEMQLSEYFELNVSAFLTKIKKWFGNYWDTCEGSWMYIFVQNNFSSEDVVVKILDKWKIIFCIRTLTAVILYIWRLSD